MSAPITYDQIAAVLRHENGVLYWTTNRKGSPAGGVAGHLNKTGYIALGLMYRKFLGHRIVWLLEYGEWPSGFLDHRNGIRTDNRPENLRLCNVVQNNGNRRPSVGRFKGVTVHKKTGKFQVQIAHQYIGLFDDAESAARAYDAAAMERYGEFACTNFGVAA